MTDTHIRLLRLLMNQSQRQLAHHTRLTKSKTLHLNSGANTSSERQREPELTSRAPKHDAITGEQTQCPDLGSRTREESAPRLTVLRLPGHPR